MMRNRLDKLFSNQLSKHLEKPSSNAWGQIHDQLNRKRKILWFRRIGIAASFLLLISIGYFGYYSSDGQVTIKGEMVTESVEVIKPDGQSAIDIENNGSKKIDFNEVNIEDNTKHSSIVNHKKNKLRSAYPKIEEERLRKYDIKPQMVIETQIPEKERNVIIEYQTFHENKPPEIIQANITDMESSAQIQTTKMPEKPSMKIKIIYKSGKDSRLSMDDKKSYLDRSVDKINNFSSKHLLTEDRKKILRDSKEDLLALNLGKLFKN